MKKAKVVDVSAPPRPQAAPVKRLAVLVSLVLIALLGFIAYANSLNGKFVWDDEFLIEKNVFIRDWSYLSKVFTTDVGAGGPDPAEYVSYRPIQTFSYMINYAIGKFDVRVYHLTNILLHILAALAVFWLIMTLFKDNLLALFTAALFTASPLNTAAVSYISGRADPLATLFMMLTLVFYVKVIRSNNILLYLLMLASYALALISRENSLMLPALVLLYHFAFKEKIRPVPFLSLLSVIFVYLFLRLTVLVSSKLTHLMVSTTVSERLPGFFAAIANYLKLIFLPFPLHMEYGHRFFRMSDPQAFTGIALTVILLAYAVKIKDKNRLASFSILWFFIALLPVSNIYPVDAYMAEHWLYLPSIGIFLLIAGGVRFLWGLGNIRIFGAILIAASVTSYTYLTIRQNDYWRDPVALYKKTLEYSPNSAKSYNNLGIIYKNSAKYKEAMECFRMAVALDPKYEDAVSNLGSMYLLRGKTDKALELFNRTLELNPDSISAAINLGKLYLDTGRYDEAIASCKKAIKIAPTNPFAYNNLGMAYNAVKRNEEAVLAFKEAAELDPDSADAYVNLGKAYDDMGKRDDAIAVYKKALGLSPDSGVAHNNIAVTYYYTGRYDLAIEHCDTARKLGFSVNPQFLKLLEPYRKR